MTRQEAEAIVAGLPPELGELGKSIAGEIDREFANAEAIAKLRFPVHESLLTREAYDHFRTTGWLLTGGPDDFFGPNMHLAVIRPKVPVSPTPQFCYHATEATNHNEIEAKGLFPGNRVEKGPRDDKFSDSVHYIFVSLSEEEAINWINVLPGRGDFRVYRITVEGFELVPDPCAEAHGCPPGYILTTDHVPAALIVDSILVPRSKDNAND